jgi:hypothetical protein
LSSICDESDIDDDCRPSGGGKSVQRELLIDPDATVRHARGDRIFTGNRLMVMEGSRN